jgi:phosphoribosyl 1,2-cyclic phosphodiesterase
VGELRHLSLSSSSTHGNAYLVLAPATRLLVDCGLSCRRLEAALTTLGVHPSSLDAVFLTHEHGDHTRALALRRPFADRYGIPVFAPPEFWWAWQQRGWRCQGAYPVAPGTVTEIGELSVTCFAKPHDGVNPVGYLVSYRGQRLGIVTDLGEVPDGLVSLLSDADYLVFESNHDPQMEIESGRNWALVRRVLGPNGHLSNQQAGTALARIVGPSTRSVLLAHLSLDCNRPDLAFGTVAACLAGTAFKGRLAVAPPSSTFEPAW